MVLDFLDVAVVAQRLLHMAWMKIAWWSVMGLSEELQADKRVGKMTVAAVLVVCMVDPWVQESDAGDTRSRLIVVVFLCQSCGYSSGSPADCQCA